MDGLAGARPSRNESGRSCKTASHRESPLEERADRRRPFRVAATATRVIVADKSETKDQDIWRCLDAETGKELWTVAYATPTQMEFTNAPRAAPVIEGNFVYLLGAFGDLHCVNLYGSGVVWRATSSKTLMPSCPPGGHAPHPWWSATA